MMRTRWVRVTVAALAMLSSTVLGLVAMEGVSRLLFSPMDYLQPELERDARLGHRIAPGSGGHDAWGFRNLSVPAHADVVTIGDSMTYGWNAASAETWPGWFAAMSSRTVYNLGMGGYGPVQYAALLGKALTLEPSLVVVGLYYGNDLLDAYRVAYGNPEWRGLRAPGRPAGNDGDLSEFATVLDDQSGAFAGLRSWLGSHSLLYRRIILSRLGDLARTAEMRVYGVTRDGYVHVDDPGSGVAVAFAPQAQARALRQDDDRVREGMRLTLELLVQMNSTCRAHGVRFVVVLIPTKETVYARALLASLTGKQSSIVRSLVADEERADDELRTFLTQNSVEHLATLPSLREAATRGTIYPNHHDVHPLPAGYEVIARTVWDHVRDESSPGGGLRAAR